MVRPQLSPELAAALAAPVDGPVRHLTATPDTCFWGYFDQAQTPVLEVESGDIIRVEAVTHHAGDAPDLLMDEGIEAIWAGIPEDTRTPGVHIMTGPIAVAGAEPGDTLVVRILDMTPRLPHGSNCAANWGLLYDTFGKERITIYELAGDASAGFTATAEPRFGFDFTARPLYDLPGVITPPDAETRRPFSVPVSVPVRPHLGVMGVAPPEPGRLNSIPPGVFGGNVDNWRLGPGAAMCYPVFVEGARLFVGDPHFAQGDGEICGTAIEASLDATIQVHVIKDLSVSAPVMHHGDHWITHGFGDDLDAAMRMAAEQMLWLLTDRMGLDADDAYSLCSVAMDLGVTQVVDGTIGCHAIIDRSIFTTP
jgi:acetamidase/formamidase